MTPDHRRRDALNELRESLASGEHVDSAVTQIAAEYGFRPEVLRQIGSALIDVQDQLLAERNSAKLRADRRRRLSEVMRRYKAALQFNLHAEVDGKPIVKGLSRTLNAGEIHAITRPKQAVESGTFVGGAR